MANEGMQSAFTRLAIGGYKMCFERIEPIDAAKLVDHSAKLNCGTRQRMATDQSPSIKILGFTAYLQPTPEELAVLLPLIGWTLNTGTYRWTDTRLSTFTCKTARQAERTAATEWVRSYTNCRVNVAQFYSSKGQPLNLALQIFAMGYDDEATFSETEVSNNSTPFVHSQSATTLDGATRYYTQFRYAVNNRLNVEHNNSVLPTNIDEADRIETVSFNMPQNDEHTDLILDPWDDTARAAGIAGSTVFTRGGKSLTLAWDVLKSEANVPALPIRGNEIRFQKNYNVYLDDALSATLVTLDTSA